MCIMFPGLEKNVWDLTHYGNELTSLTFQVGNVSFACYLTGAEGSQGELVV